jgi:hypothetical protein
MMQKWRCDGKGLKFGKKVIVRERTRLKDGGLFVGVIKGIEGDNAKSIVWIEREDGLLTSTHKHCVYATKSNLEKLSDEIEKELSKNSKAITKLSEELDKERGFIKSGIRHAPECDFKYWDGRTEMYDAMMDKCAKLVSVRDKLEHVAYHLENILPYAEDEKDEVKVCIVKENEREAFMYDIRGLYQTTLTGSPTALENAIEKFFKKYAN